jgi:hypothetical protein
MLDKNAQICDLENQLSSIKNTCNSPKMQTPSQQ